jgi:hypothetical protein
LSEAKRTAAHNSTLRVRIEENRFDADTSTIVVAKKTENKEPEEVSTGGGTQR